MFPRRLTSRAVLALACGLALACNREPRLLPENVAARTAPLPREVVQRVKAATTLVSVPDGSGSGAWVGMLGEQALVVTNAHVVKEENRPALSKAELVFDSNRGVRRTRPARVLAVDESADLALLSVEPPENVQPLALGPGRTLGEGAPLYVSGFPFGVLLGADGERPSATLNPGLSTPRHFWQRDIPSTFQPLVAGINPGNSGGPVVDAGGRLRGIAVAHFRGTEASFMVPAEELRRFVSASLPEARFTWEEVPAPPATPTLAPEPPNLKELLRSTVRVRAGASVSSGFVQSQQGRDLIVLCNRHAVLTEDSKPLGTIEVSATGEDGRELTGRGEVIRSDATEDLALLRVKGLPALPALVPDDGQELAETDPIWVLGLSRPDAQNLSRSEPLRGVVSGKRYDRGVELALLQVDIGINAENTGGPVVDARGRVVGLAVWRHPKTNVSVVIPGLRLKDLLAGALSGGLMSIRHDGVDRCLVDVTAVMDDPLGNLVKMGLVAMSPATDIYMPEGARTVLDVGRTVRTAPTEQGVARLQAVLEPCRAEERGFQVWVERADGTRQVTRPFFVRVERRTNVTFRGSYQPGDREPRIPVPQQNIALPGWTDNRCAPQDGHGCFNACAFPETGALSCVAAGDLAFMGRGGLPLDTEEARRQYVKACEAEEVEGCERLLQLYPEGTEGRPAPEAVLAMHHRLCELGRLSSCFVETLPLWRTPGELERAMASFEENCEGGEPRSCVMRGVAYETGRGVDKAEAGWAEHYYQQACYSELNVGCHDLAVLKLKDERPEERAGGLQLLEGTCARGFGPSCNDYGRLLAQGQGVPADAKRAATLFERACRAGVAQACRNQKQKDASLLEAVGGAQEATFSTPSLALPAIPPPPPPRPEGSWPPIEELKKFADIGHLSPSVAVKGNVDAGMVQKNLQSKFYGTGRCILVRLSYDDRWMKRRPGTKAKAVLVLDVEGPRARKSQVKVNTTNNAWVSRCVTNVYSGTFYVDGPPDQRGQVILSVDITR